MMECMSEEDITKLKDDVGRQEEEFNQQQTEIEELRAAFSDLKNENDQLKEDLRNTTRLAHNGSRWLRRAVVRRSVNWLSVSRRTKCDALHLFRLQSPKS